MRRIPPVLVLVAASSLAANGGAVLAQGVENSVIMSNDDGAMLPPEHWDCQLYVEEYRSFIEDGNRPDAWRFYGKRYKVASTGELYDWQGWLEWEENNRCATPDLADETPDGPARGQRGFGGMTAVGIVAGLLGVGAVAAGGGGGSNSDSPG